MSSKKILNPATNRFVNYGSQKYYRLVNEGVIKLPVEVIPDVKTDNINYEKIQVKPDDINYEKIQVKPVKQLLAEELTTIVKENKKEFQKELTQKETDALLRRLLYEKLCISKKGKSKKEEKPKKKKKKYKIKTPPPSSESESESESSD
jgi:hypothetical protein